MARSAVIDLFQAALQANKAAIVNNRGIYRIVAADQAIAGASINTDDSPDPEQVGSGLQVVQLKYVAAPTQAEYDRVDALTVSQF